MFIVVLGLAFLAAATEARTRRDTTWVPSDPQAFELKLGFDQVGRIVTTIGMVSREKVLSIRSIAQ